MPGSALNASTLDHLLEGFQVIGFDWKYRYLNDAAVKQSKYKREQLIGHTMMECFPGIQNTELFKALKLCMQARTPANIENHFVYPDGSDAWFELHIQSVPEGIFVLSMDISQRKKAEFGLAQLNERLENLVKERTGQLEAKNKELMDSISYAKDIQRAFLNTRSEIEQSFSDSFVLYKPKDVLSGDFYWCRRKENGVLLAAADCTGHGVPGALMSMIGIEKLNQLSSQTDEPDVILNQLNREIKDALQSAKSESTSNDGMDIALCCVSADRKKLTFAGASRPLWIMRKGATEIEQVKTCIRSIGGYTDYSQAFGSQQIDVEKGDTVYLFSDGYADTFGGESFKKLTTKRFKQLLSQLYEKTMREQHQFLSTFLDKWKGGSEQTDDVLVIGVRI